MWSNKLIVIGHIATASVTASILFSCTTTGKPEFKASKVIERMGGKDETPEWTHGEVAMIAEGSDVIFVQTMSVAGNARPEGCLQGAELSARAAFLRHVQENISSSGQLNEQSMTGDPSYESLTAFLSQGKISGAKVAARYWERLEQSEESGDRVLKLRCSVKLAIKKSDLESQLRQALGLGGNAAIREKLMSAQQSFIQNIGQQGHTSDKAE